MQTRVIVKTLIFNDQKQVLILQRSADDSHRAGGFDFPGGATQDDEPLNEGAIREINEETGLTLKAADLQLVYATCKTAYHTELKQQSNLVWLGFAAVAPDGQTVTLSHEHARFAWLSLDEFLIASDHPAHHTFINYLRQNGIVRELWDDDTEPSNESS